MENIQQPSAAQHQPVKSFMNSANPQPPIQLTKEKNMSKLIAGLVFAVVFFIVAASLTVVYLKKPELLPFNLKSSNKPGAANSILAEKPKFTKFTSKEEFAQYIATSQSSASQGIGTFSSGAMRALDTAQVGTLNAPAPQAAMKANLGAPMEGTMAERASETNVQVKGIDEPDIVKTDGKNIFFSSQMARVFASKRVAAPMVGQAIQPSLGIMPPTQYGETKVISALPVDKIKQIAGIDKTGELLVNKNMLVVVGNDNHLYGFDTTNTASPSAKWTLALEDNTSLESVRQYQDTIYLMTRTYVDSYEPCPIRPLSMGANKIAIECTDIYHPSTPSPVDATYTAFAITMATGKIEKTVAFTGSSSQTSVYMSPNALYAAYTYSGNMVDIMYQFFAEDGQGLVSQEVVDKLSKLKTYELSASARSVELTSILDTYQRSLGKDERLKFETELSNRMDSFVQKHIRDLEETGIAKIDLKDFKVVANGTIPGHTLNQFSMDEYEGNLRIATTTMENMMFTSGNRQSVNDVYVLDNNLNVKGSVQDLGKGERIYSARFMGDKGYIVTFKQTDPFYVLDLSNPQAPQLKGELKIPGYSSYLHPLAENIILGVGMEGSQVKLSVFDVSKPEAPIEIDKYMVDEYWSEISSTHHAFLQDEKHKIFFLPGGKGGYVFGYEGNKLKLLKAISGLATKRALYLNDYLYVVSEDKLAVINEQNWELASELKFESDTANTSPVDDIKPLPVMVAKPMAE